MMTYTKWIAAALLGCVISEGCFANLKPSWDAKYRTLAFYSADFPIKLSPSVKSHFVNPIS